MENETVMTIAKINSAIEVLQGVRTDLANKKTDPIKQPELEDEKLWNNKACRFVGVSQPTFDKLVKKGKFKPYWLGHRKYFLKSELIIALKTQQP